MKHKSKSKTFPKGTDTGKIGDWFDEVIELDTKTAEPCAIWEETRFKYLITITKIEDETTKQTS